MDHSSELRCLHYRDLKKYLALQTEVATIPGHEYPYKVAHVGTLVRYTPDTDLYAIRDRQERQYLLLPGDNITIVFREKYARFKLTDTLE